jgi:hypothetical protein
MFLLFDQGGLHNGAYYISYVTNAIKTELTIQKSNYSHKEIENNCMFVCETRLMHGVA